MSEQVSGASLCRCSQHYGQGDVPSRGLETGVVPLDLLQRGDETGVMAVGDARPTEHTKATFSILKINFRNSQNPVNLHRNLQYQHIHKYAQVSHHGCQAKCSHIYDFPSPMNYAAAKLVFQNEQ